MDLENKNESSTDDDIIIDIQPSFNKELSQNQPSQNQLSQNQSSQNQNPKKNDHQMININSIDLLSVKDAIELYNNGSYIMSSSMFQILSLNSKLQSNIDNDIVTSYLLSSGIYNFEKYKDVDVDMLNTYLLKLITSNNELGNIVLALWHIDVNPLNIEYRFPTRFNTLFAPQTKVLNDGLKILYNLSKKSKHASYLLALYYLNTGNKNEGNAYLLRAAKMDHIDSQRMLNTVGTNWNDEDQCLDHVNFWLLVPDCSNRNTIPEKIHTCLGCGKANLESGEVEYNCLLCGCKTGLNCSSIVDYFKDGFINCLRALEHPLKLTTTLTAIVASGLITAKVQPYGEIFSFVTTGLTSLNLFINQETKKDDDTDKTK